MVKKKRSILKTILISALGVLLLAGVLVYQHFNDLVSNALMKSFNSSIISDVYELKFENLRVNLLRGSIRVNNVSLLPREKPLKSYPYINSSFRLQAESFLLDNVEIGTLLKNKRLVLRKMHIIDPEIDINLNGDKPILLPYSQKTPKENRSEDAKRPIESFLLTEFILRNASFHSSNARKERQFSVNGVTISLADLQLHSDSLSYELGVTQASLSIGSIAGEQRSGHIKQLGFSDFKIGIDSLRLDYSLDTLIYRFHNFTTVMKDLEVQTADSIYHIAMKSFDLSYKDRSVQLQQVSFQPNVSQAVLQRAYRYQHTDFSGAVGSIKLSGIRFDELMHTKKLFIEKVDLDQVKASLYKDRTKPMDSTRFPVYLGQTIQAIKMPLRIRKINATRVELKNTERQPDGTEASVLISNARLTVDNISNLTPGERLVMRADAYLLGKVRFNAVLSFRYNKPEFSFSGQFGRFNMPDLNPLINAYTPAKINTGTADKIAFSGTAGKTSASGTMEFLYHNLQVDLHLENKAKWKSAVGAFAANTALQNSNPVSASEPPRVVAFSAERAMNKSFVNLVIKSVLNGLKETVIMSRENRKTHREVKREARQEAKKRKKQ